MRYRYLGSTGLKVSEIGFGTGPEGDPCDPGALLDGWSRRGTPRAPCPMRSGEA
jgi:aryl-alcohol dehydrogenase-like predicted oxidoreductase